MASRFGGVANYVSERAKQKRDNNSIDALVKKAQINELGYDIQESPSRFGGLFGGGQTLVQRPDFQSNKALERQKLEDELEMNSYKLKNVRKYFGGGESDQGQTFGGGGESGGSQDDFIMTPDFRFVPNPAKPRPLNELQQAQLADRQRKAREESQAAQNREDMLRGSAEDMLGTIQKAKEGAKYFGPLGDTPSIVAPSTILSAGKEYGPRAEWEANVNKLLSGKVVEIMNQMKQASKTGATGFGAMNQSELQLLKEASTALKKNLPPDVAMKYLSDMERIQKKFLTGGKRFGQPEQGGESPTDQIITGPDGRQYRIIGGDPNDPDVEPV